MTTMLAMQGVQGIDRMRGGMWGILGMILGILLVTVPLVLVIIFLVQKNRQ